MSNRRHHAPWTGDWWWPAWTPSIRLLAARLGASMSAPLGWCLLEYGLLHPLYHSETWQTWEHVDEMRDYWRGIVDHLTRSP